MHACRTDACQHLLREIRIISPVCRGLLYKRTLLFDMGNVMNPDNALIMAK